MSARLFLNYIKLRKTGFDLETEKLVMEVRNRYTKFLFFKYRIQ